MNCLFFVNPQAGRGLGQKIAHLLNVISFPGGIARDVVLTDLHRLEQQVLALAPGKDLVIVAGGDGTVSAVAHFLGLLPLPPPMAIIPIGTGNDIARATGWLNAWKNGGIHSFLGLARESKVESIDLWSCGNASSFICYLGLGMDARIVESFASLKKHVGLGASLPLNRFLYILGGLKELASGPLRAGHAHISWTDERGETGSHHLGGAGTAILANIPWYAGGGRLSFVTSPGDGLIDLYFMPRITDFIVLLLKSRFPKTFVTPKPECRARSITIANNSGLHLHVDGTSPPESVLREQSLPVNRIRALPFLIPPGHGTAPVKSGREAPMQRFDQQKGCITAPDPVTSSRQDTTESQEVTAIPLSGKRNTR